MILTIVTDLVIPGDPFSIRSDFWVENVVEKKPENHYSPHQPGTQKELNGEDFIHVHPQIKLVQKAEFEGITDTQKSWLEGRTT